MKSYMSVLFVVAGLSAWTEFDPSMGQQRDEFLPPISFEPFVYVLFIFTGLSILLSLKSEAAKGFSKTFVLPFSAGFTGWGLGVSLAQALQLHFASAAAGVVLSAVMALVTLSPVIISSSALKLADDVKNRWFAKKASVWAVNILGIWLFGSGCVGLATLYLS